MATSQIGPSFYRSCDELNLMHVAADVHASLDFHEPCLSLSLGPEQGARDRDSMDFVERLSAVEARVK